MNIPVKICGITSLKDAKIAVNCGASAIGLIFFQGSPRYVDPGKVKNWILDIPKNVKKVGVFVNENIENIHSIVRDLNLDFIQLHGHESPDYCYQMIKPVIKVFRVGDDFDSNVLKDYQVAAFLFDTYQKGRPGGTGESFNWDLISDLRTDTPIILSGGLNPENINNISVLCTWIDGNKINTSPWTWVNFKLLLLIIIDYIHIVITDWLNM